MLLLPVHVAVEEGDDEGQRGRGSGQPVVS